MRLLFSLCLLTGLALTSVGCTPIGVVVGAGAYAGSTALQERGFEQAMEDTATALKIRNTVIEADFETFQRLDVSVVEGRVLLTGVVPKEADRINAVEASWKAGDVVEVINEVEIGPDSGIVDTGYDLKIEKSLDLELTLDRDVQAVNYIADSSDGTLHLIGIAQSQAELDRVLAHARRIERVRRVVSHVLLKDSPERQELLKRLAELKAQDSS